MHESLAGQQRTGDVAVEVEAGSVSSEPTVDWPFLFAEISALLLGTLSFLLILSGLGFWTVHPPGEHDLCQVDTLGLENSTDSDRDLTLSACHGLYDVVFSSLHVMSVPFVGSGACAGAAFYAVFMGITAKSEDVTPGWFRRAVCYELVGGAVNFVPALWFPGVAAVVAAGLAPIHAYFITITVTHVGLQVANVTESNDDSSHTDDAIRNAAYLEEILYKGYCAASRVELCLFVGSLAMNCLTFVFLFDMVRNVSAITCYKPKYAQILGSQLRLVCNKGRGKYTALRETGGA